MCPAGRTEGGLSASRHGSVDRSLAEQLVRPSGIRADLARFLALAPLVAIVAFVALAWLADWGRAPDRRAVLVVGVLGALLALGLNVLLGHFYFRPRPFLMLSDIHALLPQKADSSTSDQIRHSGHPKPTVVLQVPGFGQDTPEALAFNRLGRLWISSYSDNVVVGLSPSQLVTGTPRPALRLDLPSDSGPIGLTVDASGRLWVAEGTRDTVVALSVDHPVRMPHPLMTLTGNVLQMPHTITFDVAGSAWLPAYNGVLARFDASRLRAGVPGTSESGDDFGVSVAVGDFNGDGKGDVAVGVSGEEIGSTTDAGLVDVGLRGPGAGPPVLQGVLQQRLAWHGHHRHPVLALRYRTNG